MSPNAGTPTEYLMPSCPDCLADEIDPCEHPPINGCPAGFPCIFPFECRNIDVHDQKPACLGSKETRERVGCMGHQIAWFPDGYPEGAEE